jgi:hypothetical protein
MTEKHFSMLWNHFKPKTEEDLKNYLEHFTDVTLAAEGQLFKAHRLVLSTCSTYFKDMFIQTPQNQHPLIFMKDVSAKILKDLIHFMYCGEVKVHQADLPAFVATAKALDIKGLALLVKLFLKIF